MKKLKQIGANAKKALSVLNSLDGVIINKVLFNYNQLLLKNKKQIIKENTKCSVAFAGENIELKIMKDGINQEEVAAAIKFLNDLEQNINETRQELNFCKKEVSVLKTEEDVVSDMAQNKCTDVEKYLNKEINYLHELIKKANAKQ